MCSLKLLVSFPHSLIPSPAMPIASLFFLRPYMKGIVATSKKRKETAVLPFSFCSKFFTVQLNVLAAPSLVLCSKQEWKKLLPGLGDCMGVTPVATVLIAVAGLCPIPKGKGQK